MAELPELDFEVAGGGALAHAASPTVRLNLRVRQAGGPPVQSLLLETQVRIAPRRRGYGDDEQERLVELFGARSQWAHSMQGLLWANVTLHVPRVGDDPVAVDLPCSYDLEVSAARYLTALDDGAIPLELLFAGTVLYAGERGTQIARLPLDREARYELPVSEWRVAVDRHFPGAAWLRLRRDSFERLHAYRSRRMLGSWEAVLDELLAAAGEGAAAR